MLLEKLGQTNPGHRGHTSHGDEIVKHLVFSLRVEKASLGKTLLQSKVSSQDRVCLKREIKAERG